MSTESAVETAAPRPQRFAGRRVVVTGASGGASDVAESITGANLVVDRGVIW